MRRRHWPRLAGCLATVTIGGSCTPELDPIVLDISKNCNEVEVVVIAPELGLSPQGADEIVQTAADGSAPNSAWALVVPAGGEAGNLFMRHLAAGQVISQVDLGIPVRDKLAIQLRASPTEDEVYVTRSGPADFRLWRVIERDPFPYIQASAQLGAFPNDAFNCAPCDTTDWHRDLIFLQGSPYLLSVPPFSPSVAISVWVGTLTATNNGIGDYQLTAQERLNFEPRCDPELPPEELERCDGSNMAISHPTVQVLGRQIDPRPATNALLAMRGRQELEVPVITYDVFVVHVGLDDDGVPAGILRSEQTDFEITQPPGPPGAVAVDEFATYAYVNLPLAGTQLLRLELAEFDRGFTALAVPELDTMRLLQLNHDVALGRVRDGAWELTKLFPDSVEQSRTIQYQSDAPIVDFEPAGPGVFLLRREAAAPELVRLRCASTDDGSGT